MSATSYTNNSPQTRLRQVPDFKKIILTQIFVVCIVWLVLKIHSTRWEKLGNYGSSSERRRLRMLVVLILSVFSLFTIHYLYFERSVPANISYTELITLIEENNVDEAEITTSAKSFLIEGNLRSAYKKDDNDYLSFKASKIPRERLENIIERLEESETKFDTSEAGSWIEYAQFVFWILIIAVFIFILISIKKGPGGAFGKFTESGAKLVSPDEPRVSFEDVAGCEEAKGELKETVEFLKDPIKFSRLGGRVPKGVLLIGSPGTGKTLLARAVAGEAGCPFYRISGSDFVQMFVGVGASRVRNLFEQAKENTPCIIFIDEIDAVGKRRGAGFSGGHDEREQTLNQLLVEMDGFEVNNGMILIAATNRPDVLDPALLRSGRFDRQITVGLPDRRAREEILKVHARKLPLADDVDLSIIAKETAGLSGADLANICNEAALAAAKCEGVETITTKEFKEAKDKVMFGTELKSSPLLGKEREITAYHEAGHAVVGMRLDILDPVHKVSIIPRGRALGITASIPEEDRRMYSKRWLKARLVMLFGGRAAEEFKFGTEEITTGAGNDIERATDIARRMVSEFGMNEKIGLMAVNAAPEDDRNNQHTTKGVSEHTAQAVDKEVEKMLKKAYDDALEMIKSNLDLLENIAQALLEKETLERKDLEKMI